MVSSFVAGSLSISWWGVAMIDLFLCKTTNTRSPMQIINHVERSKHERVQLTTIAEPVLILFEHSKPRNVSLQYDGYCVRRQI